MVKLTDVCEIQYGYAFDSSQFSETEGIPLVRIRDVVRGYSETRTKESFPQEYKVHDGDLLIGMDGEFNIAKWHGGEAALNQRVCRLVPKKIYEDYLYHFMPIALKKIEEKTPFVTVKHLSAKELNKIQLLLPSNEEQIEIAKILNSISKVIENRNEQIQVLNTLIKARFVEMFGDQESNPFGWQQSTIGETCTLKSGTSLPAEVENEGGPIPYVKVGDMNYSGNERYITTSSRFVTAQTAGKGIFPIGSVLFPKRGGAIGTNKKRMTILPVCADLNVMGVTSNGGLVAEYLMAFFDMIDLGALDNGSSVPQINNKDIAPLRICVPPIELQKQFATFVSQVDKSKVVVQKALDEAQLLFESLMQQYFG